jgi:5'-nucleotidase
MHQILENGLSFYPKYDGRWPCTSGLKFKFDPEQPVGERVIVDSMTLDDGTPFDMEKTYNLAAKNFIAAGKDGYVAFLDPSIHKHTCDEVTNLSI